MIFCACMNALKIVGLSLALFGLHVIAHFVRFRSMCAHSANFWRLLIWGWRWFMWFVRMPRSFAYVVVVHDFLEVLKW